MELVSILIRTCNRPWLLRGALNSVREQTYSNIEVIVVEDGVNSAENMIKEEFSDMNIHYKATGENIGRTKVGNLAMAMSTGQYLNFLDDDDILFPSHVEVLVSTIKKNNTLAAYAPAYESVVRIDKAAHNIKEYKRFVRYNQTYNRLFLIANNYFAIQSVLFSRELYEKLGGFDENLVYLEDWDLWVKYSQLTDYAYSSEITSLYRVPKMKIKRDAELFKAYEHVTKGFVKYSLQADYCNLNADLMEILDVIKYPKWKRKIKDIRNKLLYR